MAEAGQMQGRGRPARRRFVLQVLGVGIAVVLLLWGADTLARISAQTLLERNIQDATGVGIRPEVEVQGLLFLPQVIRGAYSEVHVTTRGITSGPLRIDRVDSQLFDVQVPFHDVLVGNIRQIAFAVTVGLMIDTLIVRPVLTPALLTLLGHRASWPSQRITRGERRTVTTTPESDDG